MLDDIASIIDDTGFMGMRDRLNVMFDKKCVDFMNQPVCHWRIKHDGRTIIIVNKKYADEPELIHGEFALGYEGKI